MQNAEWAGPGRSDPLAPLFKRRENDLKTVNRWLLYLAGMLVLALGLTLNTKAGLGVSPIISIAFAVSEWSR